MKTVEGYKKEILDTLENQRTITGARYVLVKDWSTHHYFGIWSGGSVDAKALQYAPCANRTLFEQAVQELLREGKVVQYDSLTTAWKACTLNVFFGIAGKEYEFAPQHRYTALRDGYVSVGP